MNPPSLPGESLARAIRAQQQIEHPTERSRRGRREDFDTFLAKVPDTPPMSHDEL